jgi:hypothetical protein
MFTLEDGRLTNSRRKVEAYLGEEVTDYVWDTLVGNDDVQDLELGLIKVPELAVKARRLAAVLYGPAERPETDEPDQSRLPQVSEATRARIDALSAIYAAWASAQPEVRRFRDTILARTCAAMSLIPGGTDGLLADDQVDHWVRWCLQAEAGDGVDPRSYVMKLIATWVEHGPRPVADLWWVADRQEKGQGVDVRGPLGQLAELAEKLADRYRWRPSGATMLVLAGWTPEVFVYTGSAQIRRGHLAAGTRVTMTLDPALSPDEVAGIYDRLRRRFHPAPPPRTQALRRYRLAEYVGPHVQMRTDVPSSRTGPGRRLAPDPTGMAFFIDPANGHTWESLRAGWNRLHGDHADWAYTPANISNFTRDAKTAVIRLLFPRWDTHCRAVGGGEQPQTALSPLTPPAPFITPATRPA